MSEVWGVEIWAILPLSNALVLCFSLFIFLTVVIHPNHNLERNVFSRKPKKTLTHILELLGLRALLNGASAAVIGEVPNLFSHPDLSSQSRGLNLRPLGSQACITCLQAAVEFYGEVCVKRSVRVKLTSAFFKSQIMPSDGIICM